MRNLKLTLAYDGTDFHGWQYLPGIRTVQGDLMEVARKLVGDTEFKILGSSRTDAGVHAVGQVAALRCESRIPAESFSRALNALLPRDMWVVRAEEMPESFHPIQDTLRKRYRYIFHDGATPELFLRNYVWRVGKMTSARLDESAMEQAARYLLGTHDFAAFENVGSPREHSIRTILDVSVHRGISDLGAFPLPLVGSPEDFVQMEVEADGFLYNMVRNIAGTLVDVGRAHRPAEWVGEVLECRDRSRAGITAPPQGLFLLQIWFKS